MATALTIFPSNVAASTLTHASTCSNTTGGSGVGIDVLLGTATGYGEFYCLGNVSAWAAAGALGNPSGRGMLWDVTTLEGQVFEAGNWTPTMRGHLNLGNGNVTADLYLRVYKYNATSLTYTHLGDCLLAAQSITSTTATYTWSATSLGELDFNAGDKLYCDFWMNVTANANTNASMTLRFNMSNSATLGVNTVQVVTPGYQAMTAVSLTDSASGADSQTTQTNITDSAIGSETITLGTITPSVTDAASGSEGTITLGVTVPGDTASGSESTTLFEQLATISDTQTTTALTAYLSSLAATTLPNAALFDTVSGGTGVGTDTTLGTATSWGEWYPRGTAQAWAALGSIGNPSGHGLLLDATTLEGMQLLGGTYTITFRGQLFNGNGNVTADITFRLYAYNANSQTYQSIGTITLSSQTITANVSATYTLSGTLNQQEFLAGDKLYVDIWFHVTVNANTASNATLRFNVSQTTSGATNAQIVTPGYAALDGITGVSLTEQLAAIADSATGTDSISAIGIPQTDAASGSETVTASAAIPVTESASGTEAVSETVSFTVADTRLLTALTAYGSNVAAATLPNAGQIVTGTGGAQVGVDTTIGTATGWGEWAARGNVAAWAALGSQGDPTGRGLLLDSTLLEGSALQAGNWTPTLRGNIHNDVGTIVADIVLRASVYHANGTYTTIGLMTLAAQTITSASTTYTFAATALPLQEFLPGDKLYLDLWFNIASNTNTASNTTLRFNLASSLSGVVQAQVVTPGYAPLSGTTTLTDFQQLTITDQDVQAGELIAFVARPPLSQPYNLPGVSLGGPYVQSIGGAFVAGGRIIPRLYGSTFYPATQGGSPLWQATDGSTQRWIDGLIKAYQAAGLTVMRPTDQWGSNAALTWDNPAIWTNMDYLVQAAAQAGIWVQMDLSGYKSVLTAAGVYAFTASFWTDFLTAVGSHYKNCNNILFYTIAGEPTFPRKQADVDALVAFFTSTIATLKSADPNHLVSPGGFINMNNGLANWWQQVWAIPGVDVCCYKTYSQNDLNHIATYSQYAVFTLGKIAVQQEFGIQQFVGDGFWTGQTVNSLAMSRASYYDQVFTNGEQNGTRCHIFWNYDHQGSSYNWAADMPSVADRAIGDDVVSLNNNAGLSIQDTATGGDLMTGLTQSYDVDPISSPATWAIILKHAARPGSATTGSVSTNTPGASASITTPQLAVAGVSGG
jgi:hypothetical protein